MSQLGDLTPDGLSETMPVSVAVTRKWRVMLTAKPLMRIVFVSLISCLSLFVYCDVAMADSNGDVIGNATGGGDYPGAVLADSPAEQAHAEAKLEAARAEIQAETATKWLATIHPDQCLPEPCPPPDQDVLAVPMPHRIKATIAGLRQDT